jgi:hypothetical protein
MNKLGDFFRNQQGIIIQGVIAVSFIIMSSIVWLCGLLITNRVFDALAPWFAISDPRALILAQTCLNAYAVSILITDGCLIVWWYLSAFKVESIESSSIPM